MEMEMSIINNSLPEDFSHPDNHIDKQLILLGSNHLPTVFLKTTLTQTIT